MQALFLIKVIVIYLQKVPYFVFLGYSCLVSNLYLNVIIRYKKYIALAFMELFICIIAITLNFSLE